MKEIGLYLHFPFCVRKCAYCDFLSFPADEELKRIYAIAMIREIRGYAKAASSYRVGSIYLGGGTPSLMPARMMKEIMNTVRDHFEVDPDAEISMEVNPGTVNPSNLGFIAEAVNRVSLGVQSANDEELKTLGRIHTFRDAERSAGLIRQAGIANLNLDLMLGIPGQTCVSFRDSLEAVLALQPEHISAYSLIVEDGTEFRRLQKEGKLMLPDEDSERDMYAAAGDMLGRAGFNRYEFSNYARTGYRCRHNVRYWKRGYYLGFGGTSTYKNNKKVREVLVACPEELFVLETDCPYLAPEPFRGRRNDPSMTEFVAQNAALVRGTDFAHIAEQSTKNARVLFSRMNLA